MVVGKETGVCVSLHSQNPDGVGHRRRKRRPHQDENQRGGSDAQPVQPRHSLLDKKRHPQGCQPRQQEAKATRAKPRHPVGKGTLGMGVGQTPPVKSAIRPLGGHHLANGPSRRQYQREKPEPAQSAGPHASHPSPGKRQHHETGSKQRCLGEDKSNPGNQS